MNKNIGTKDRLFRLTLSLFSGIGILFVDAIILKVVLALVSLFTLYETLVGWCAFYTLIGKNTCPLNGNRVGPSKSNKS